MAVVSNKFEAISDLLEEVEDSQSHTNSNKRKELPSFSSDDSFSSPISKKPNKECDSPSKSNSNSETQTPCPSSVCTVKMSVDQAIAALNKKVDSLCTSEQLNNMNKCLGDEISKMRSEFSMFKTAINEKIDRFDGILFEMQKKVDNVVKENNDLRIQNLNLHKRISDCEKANNDLEQYTRRENVRVFNMKEEKDETIQDVTNKVCELFTNSLKVKTVPEDLQACHRVGKSSPGSERSVIVRFKDRTLRDNVLKERRFMLGMCSLFLCDLL